MVLILFRCPWTQWQSGPIVLPSRHLECYVFLKEMLQCNEWIENEALKWEINSNPGTSESGLTSAITMSAGIGAASSNNLIANLNLFPWEKSCRRILCWILLLLQKKTDSAAAHMTSNSKWELTSVCTTNCGLIFWHPIEDRMELPAATGQWHGPLIKNRISWLHSASH